MPQPLAARTRLGASTGFGAGLFAGLLIGAGEALAIAASGIGTEAQVLWFGPLLYAAALGGVGLIVGAATATVCRGQNEILGWASTLTLLATFVPASVGILAVRIQRDVYLEHALPETATRALLASAATVSLLLLFAGPRLFRGRLGELLRTPTVLVSLFGVSVAGAASALLLSNLSQPDAPRETPAALLDRPNVVLVVVDALRADALSCYGGTTPTPAMCSLADAGGSRFEGFSHAPSTKPATATILSSLLPSSHGATSPRSVVPRDVELLSEVMRGNGYASGGIVASPQLTSSSGFNQGYDEYHDLGPQRLLMAKESSGRLLLHQALSRFLLGLDPNVEVEDFYPSAETVNEVAFDFLERHQDSRFFLLLHYMDPHEPYFAHPELADHVGQPAFDGSAAGRSEALRQLYHGEVAYLDGHFGRFLERLDALGLRENTVVALVADHGAELAERGRWGHGSSLFDEQIRVPFLIRWAPDQGVEGADGELARMLDVAPTLVGQTGTRPPSAMQGLDLAEHLDDRNPREHMVFAEAEGDGLSLRALRTEDWKWIRADADDLRRATEALYHVREDPGETRNVADGRAPMAQELAAHAGAQESLARAKSVLEDAARLSPGEVEVLRELGYVQ